jgi:hypothetical protein
MSEPQIINLLSIDVFKLKLSGINNNILVQEICAQNGELDVMYLEDKHHTYYEDKRYPFGMPESEKLIGVITDAVNSVIDKEMVLEDIWTLTLEDGQSVAAHSHKSNKHMNDSEYFSIAYYPHAPDGSADLIFLIDACNTIEKSISITPQTGDLVVFNSYLMHMTNRHRNNQLNRIVVSANFAPLRPDNRATQDWSAYSRNQNQEVETITSGKTKIYDTKVLTPFGPESYSISVDELSKRVVVVGDKGIVETSQYEVSDESINFRFTTNTPIDADCYVRISIDKKSNTLHGTLQINDYPEYKITGTAR